MKSPLFKLGDEGPPSSPKKPLPEPFRAKNPKFSLDPIPAEFLKEEIMEFIVELPIEGYPDFTYINQVLVPHFEETYNEITPAILEISDLITEVRNLIKSSPIRRTSLNLQVKESYLNAIPYRRFRVIYPIFTSIRTSLNATRLSLLTRRYEILQSIQNLCKYLAEHPRYVHINQQHALQSWRAIEFDYMPEVFCQYRAYKNVLDDISIQLSFIPQPFSNVEVNKSFVKKMINAHLKLRDPDTHYVPYTDEFQVLTRFLLSNSSPLQIRSMKHLNDQQLPSALDQSHNELVQWLSLNSAKSRNQKEVIKSILVRLLFERYSLYETPRGMASESLQKRLSQLTTCTMMELGIGEDKVPQEFLGHPPSELFSKSPILAGTCSDLLSCLFMTDPIDAAYIVHKTNLKIAALLANVKNEGISQSLRFDDLFALWKAALIASQIPEPDQLFRWISRWKRLETMPPKFVESCRIPRAVIKSLMSSTLNTDDLD